MNCRCYLLSVDNEKIVIFGELEGTVEVLVVDFKISLAYTCRDWGKSQKTSIMIIVSILSEVWTGHLSNTSQKCYHVSHFAWLINKSIIWIWCSHSGDCEEYDILVCSSMQFSRSPLTFQRTSFELCSVETQKIIFLKSIIACCEKLETTPHYSDMLSVVTSSSWISWIQSTLLCPISLRSILMCY